ncbi:MAG TPA: MlaD family protein [Acidiferrobacterales bacterium]|nr:MlaD family protein [Acidiferrobacterales bacterium]
MEEKVNFAVVGVFVLVLSTALIGGVLWLSSGRSYRTSYEIYQTYMKESVAGLNLNASVRYRGVEVGRVQKIALAPGNVEQVQLTLAIETGTPIKVDTVAVLSTQGLTGISFVDLTGGSRDAPKLKAEPGAPYPVISSGPSLMVRLDASLIDAAHTLKNAARMSEQLPQLVQRIQHSADVFDNMSNELARAGTNASVKFTGETLPEIHQLVMELRDMTASLRRIGNQLEKNPSILLYGKPAEKRGPGE